MHPSSSTASYPEMTCCDEDGSSRGSIMEDALSRINTNVPAIGAINQFWRNQSELSLRLQRLSTGLQINSGKDAPAGLIASEALRSEMAGINQAIDNSQ